MCSQWPQTLLLNGRSADHWLDQRLRTELQLAFDLWLNPPTVFVRGSWEQQVCQCRTSSWQSGREKGLHWERGRYSGDCGSWRITLSHLPLYFIHSERFFFNGIKMICSFTLRDLNEPLSTVWKRPLKSVESIKEAACLKRRNKSKLSQLNCKGKNNVRGKVL